MTTVTRPVFGAIVLGLSLLLPDPARAQGIPQPCVDDSLQGGALSRLCVPLGWNGQLVVYAHGFVPAGQPLGFYNLTTADGTLLSDFIQSLGFAFATTSYRKNGLAILEGVQDMQELIAKFTATYSMPLRTHVAGVSEGGLVTALLAERSPELFASAFAACGPVGSFRAQLDYLGDFRVLFDYFFPGILPGSAINIPPALMANWFTLYAPLVTAALASNPPRALQLMRTARAPFDPADPSTIVNTALDVLFYNVFVTNEAVIELGGHPFENRLRWYSGSSDDLRLNLRVARFGASPVAINALRSYQTSGDLSIPLVTLHTIRDDVVPVWQELLYLVKFDPSARGRFIPLPVNRYGHCNFTTTELAGAFKLAVQLP